VSLLNEINLLTQESNDQDPKQETNESFNAVSPNTPITASNTHLNDTGSCRLTKIVSNKFEIVTIEKHNKLLENIRIKLVKSGESLRDLEFTKQILNDKDKLITTINKENDE